VEVFLFLSNDIICGCVWISLKTLGGVWWNLCRTKTIRNHRCCEVHSWSMVISYDMLKNLRQISWRLDRLLLSRNSFQTLHQFQQDILQIHARYFHLLFLRILYWSSDSVLSCGFTKPNQPTDHVLVIIKLTICCLRCFKKNKSHWEIRGQKVPSISLFFQIEFLTVFMCFYH